jgi:hypothetical protein
LTGSPLILDLLGTRFSIEAPGPRWATFLRRLWHEFELESPGPEALIVRIEERDDGIWLTLPGESSLPFDDAWKLAEVVRYWIVEHAVQRAEGIVVFHGAALTKDEAAILCAGRSGAGKTTLAVALARRGWALASDDVAPIDLATGLVQPFPKPLGVRQPDLWEPDALTWGAPWPLPASGPVLVPADRFARRREPFLPNRLFFVEYDPGSEPLSEPIGAGRAAALSIEYVREGGEDAVRALARLCRNAPARRLRYRNSDEAVEMVEKAAANPQK